MFALMEWALVIENYLYQECRIRRNLNLRKWFSKIRLKCRYNINDKFDLCNMILAKFYIELLLTEIENFSKYICQNSKYCTSEQDY